MNSYKELKDTITLTTASVNVSQGSFIQLRVRSKRNTPIRITCDGVEYQIQSGDITPKFDGVTIVYKDATETEVFIERSTYTLDGKVDNDEFTITGKTNPLTGGLKVSAPDGGLMRIDVPRQVDVLVYGATPGGIAAAISAKREGASVVVIEKDDWIGGMMTGGLSLADVNISHSRANVVGFAREFFDEMAQDYLFARQSFFQVSFNGEPRTYQRVIHRMLQKAGIQIFTGAPLSGVVKSATKILSASFDNVGPIEAKGFIDSTYEGDLMGVAGCSYFIGREANATYGETNNGIRAVGTSAQFTDGLDPYVTAGNAASGLLPGVWDDALGTTGAASPYVQSYNYRLCVTNNAGNKVAWPEPDNYDPLNYELLGREAVLSGSGWTTPRMPTCAWTAPGPRERPYSTSISERLFKA